MDQSTAKREKGRMGMLPSSLIEAEKERSLLKNQVLVLEGLSLAIKKLEKSLANTNRTAQKLEPRSRETKMNTS